MAVADQALRQAARMAQEANNLFIVARIFSVWNVRL